LEDDGDIVEPDTYLPVVPMIAVNGSVGIGTGFSTNIPPHNPKEIVELLKGRISGTIESLSSRTLNPWWIGFRGAVERKEDKQWITRAVYEWQDASCSVKITELPVGVWTKDYKIFLDTMMQGEGPDAKTEEKVEKKTAGRKKKGDDESSVSEEKKRKVKPILKSFEDLYNDVDVNFVIYLDSDYYKKAKESPSEFEKLFHLTSSWKTTNMCCFDPNMNIVKYDTIGDILEQFYTYRIGAYEKRRQHQIGALKDELEELDAKLQFIKAIVEGKLKIMNEEDSAVLNGLRKLGLPPRSDRGAPDTLGAYEYLLRMRVDRIKKSSINEAETDVAEVKKRLIVLENTNAATIWKTELDAFLDVWNKTELKMLEMMTASSGEVKLSKKKVVRKQK
jgi:DNA topoisomerase-2